jgi:hypothetical protein
LLKRRRTGSVEEKQQNQHQGGAALRRSMGSNVKEECHQEEQQLELRGLGAPLNGNNIDVGRISESSI